MPRIPPFVTLLVFAGCSDGAGTDDTTGLTTGTPTDPTIRSQVCEQADVVYEGCATGTSPTSPTTTTTESCEEALAPCSDADIALYFNYLDCVEVACDYLDCLPELSALSAECIGTTGSTTG